MIESNLPPTVPNVDDASSILVSFESLHTHDHLCCLVQRDFRDAATHAGVRPWRLGLLSLTSLVAMNGARAAVLPDTRTFLAARHVNLLCALFFHFHEKT